MKAQIVINLDGTVSFITREGTFEGGKARTEALFEELGLLGLDIKLDKPIEQHLHGPDGEAISGRIDIPS